MKKYIDYHQNQAFLLPPTLDEMISEKDLVRVVNNVINNLDRSILDKAFEGGGRPSYNPVMMLKVLVYAYCNKIYSCRNIAKALKRDVNFMWLSAMQYPDFNTVNRFRSKYLKTALPEVFAGVVDYLLKNGYVKGEDYFVDGTKFEADAARFSYVWKKNSQRYSEMVRKRALEIMKEADLVNEEDEEKYGSQDLPEYGDKSNLSSDDLKKAADKVASKINDNLSYKEKRSLKSKQSKLNKEAEKLQEYEEQLKVLGERNSFSKTDPDATFMRMKNDELRAGYNVQIGTQDTFVTGFSVNQNANDATAFIDHMEQRDNYNLPKVENVVADSVYGTEENYEYLEQKGIESYLKYPFYHKERAGNIGRFAIENFCYDLVDDTYICPGNRIFKLFKESTRITKSGYKQSYKEYQCYECVNCEFKDICNKGRDHRGIKINKKLNQYRYKTMSKFSTEKGQFLNKRRGPEVETPFGDTKHNMGYRRIRLRGLEKASVEMALIFTSFNLRKLHIASV